MGRRKEGERCDHGFSLARGSLSLSLSLSHTHTCPHMHARAHSRELREKESHLSHSGGPLSTLIQVLVGAGEARRWGGVEAGRRAPNGELVGLCAGGVGRGTWDWACALGAGGRLAPAPGRGSGSGSLSSSHTSRASGPSPCRG